MGVTVYVNRRSAAHRGAGGQAVSGPPDVCKTPTGGSPVPVPYVVVGRDATGTNGSRTVRADSHPLLLRDSELAMVSGDEAGTLGGIVSGVNLGIAKFASYSFDVKVEGRNAARHLDLMTMNGNSPNTVGVYSAQAATPGQWNLACLLDIMCEKDPALLEEARNSPLGALLLVDDPYSTISEYTAYGWELKFVDLGGFKGNVYDNNNKKIPVIAMERDMSCSDAAVVLKHELIHLGQPDCLSTLESETQAYVETEKWAIEKGLPTQAPKGYCFRKVEHDEDGNITKAEVDEDAIEMFVVEKYDVSTSQDPPGFECSRITDDGTEVALVNPKTIDPSTGMPAEEVIRPPMGGDKCQTGVSYANVDQIDPSMLQCPDPRPE